MRRLSELEARRRALLRENPIQVSAEDPTLSRYLAYVGKKRKEAEKALDDLAIEEAYETYLLRKARKKSRLLSANGEARSTGQSRAHQAAIFQIRKKREELIQKDPDAFAALGERTVLADIESQGAGRLVHVPYLERAREQIFASLDAGIPVYLVGHLGSGKTQLAIECATEFMEQRLLQQRLEVRMEGAGDDPKGYFAKIYREVHASVQAEHLRPYFIAGSHDLTAQDMFFEKTLKLSQTQGRGSDEDQLSSLIDGFAAFVRGNAEILQNMDKDQQLEFMLAGWKTFSNLYIAEHSGYGTTVEKIEKEVLLALREGKPIIIDEINTIAMGNLIALNDILQHHAGQTAYVTGVGSLTIAEGFCLIGTGNLSTGTVSYEGTNALNPAFQSRFTTIEYNYAPQETTGDLNTCEHPEKNELFRLLLLHLCDREGRLYLPEPEETLPALYRLAQLSRISQDIFSGRGAGDLAAGGEVPVLNEAVLSVRGLFHVLDHWNLGEAEDLSMALWNGFLFSVTNADDRNLLLALSVRCGFFPETKGWHVEAKKRGEAPLAFDDIRTDPARHVVQPLETLSREDVAKLLFGKGPKRTNIEEDLGEEILFDEGKQADRDQGLALDEKIRGLEQAGDVLTAAVTGDDSSKG